MNIETMTAGEKLKLIRALETSLGFVSVAFVDIEGARDHLQYIEPDAQRASVELILRAANEIAEENRISEAGFDAVVDWARKRLTWE